MMSCQHCQPLILDYSYGLLDEPEAVAIESHLRECATCSAVRNQVAQLQGLIARAAKSTFPRVRFDPASIKTSPTTQSKTVAATRSIPAQSTNASLLISSGSVAQTESRKGVWIAWAIAAAVLLAIPGTAIPVLGVLDRAEQVCHSTGDSVASANAAVAEVQEATNTYRRKSTDLDARVANAQQIQESLVANWVADEKNVAQFQTANKLPVDIHKPACVQPGAPNDFLLVLRDFALTPSSRLVAEVRDQTDAVIYSQKLPEQKDNHYTLHLPAETWTKLKPESELFLVVSSEDDRTGSKTRLQDKVQLFGPVYSTMLVTDRPGYRPGETVYFRSLTLDRSTFLPPNREQFLRYELLGPQHFIAHRSLSGGTDLVRTRDGKVEPVLGPDGKPLRGVGCGAFTLPADLKEGDYVLRLSEIAHPGGYPGTLHDSVTRSIKIRGGESDAYAKQIGFSAASYSAGETVEAWAELKLQDQPVTGAEVKVAAMADNAQVLNITAPITGADGRTSFRFTLPRNLEISDVRLKVTFTKKGKNFEESIVELVPVIGHTVIVEFYPEGGKLVAGLPCRVYIRATTPSGHPVDIRGTITDGRKVLGRVETLADRDQPGANRGLGSFTFTPLLGTPVWLKLESPSGAYAPLHEGPLPVAPTVVASVPVVVASRSGFPLPTPEADGVVMTVLNPVSSPREPIRVHLNSTGRPRNLVVGAYTRGRLSDTKRVSTEPGQIAAVELMATSDPRGGVVRITVFEEPFERVDATGITKSDLKPVAERLAFRKPGEALQLSFTAGGTKTSKEDFAANTSIELNLQAKNEKGTPTAAVLWAAVVNTGIAPGKKDRLATTHFLVAGEIRNPDALEYADFLLTDHPKAAEVLDLVLATQGWRQFVEQTPTAYAPSRVVVPQEKSRLQVFNGQYPTQAEQPGVRERRKLYENYRPRYEAASKALEKARSTRDAFVKDKSADETIRELTIAAERAQNEAIAADIRAKEATQPVERFRGSGWYGVAGFGLLAAMLGVLAWVRPLSRLPYGIGTAGSVGLVAFLIVTLSMAERTEAANQVHREILGKAEQEALPASADAQTRIEEKLKLGRNAVQLKDLDSGAAAEALQGATPALRMNPTPSSPALPSDAMKIAPGASGIPQPPAPAGGSMPGPTLKPASVSPPAPPGGGLPGRGGYGGLPLGGGPPKTDPPVTVAGPSPVPFPLVMTKEKSPSEKWQPFEARKNSSEWEVTDKPVSQTLLATAALGLQDVTPAARAKRGIEMFRKNVVERVVTNMDDTGDGKPRDGVKEDKQFNLPMTQAPMMKGSLAPMNTDVMARNRVRGAILTSHPLSVREYAAPRPGTEGAENEFYETILWQPVIVLPSDGQAKLTFYLGSAKGGYQVVIAGHTLDGRIGAIRGVIPVSQPVAPTVPALTIPPTIP